MINKLIAAAALTAVSLGASAAGVNLVLDGSFETTGLGVPVTAGTWVTVPSIAGAWTADHGIEIRNNVEGSAEDGSNFAELDTTQNSTISQSIATVAGQSYQLSFWVENRPNIDADSQGIDYTVNGVTKSVIGGSTPTWTQITETFIATHDLTVLTFAATGKSDSYGTSLDNITLASAVPEPTSMALMVAGLALVGVAARRRNRQ